MPFVQIRVNFDPLFPPQTIDTSWQVACRLRNSFPGKRLRLQINPFGAENQIIASTDLRDWFQEQSRERDGMFTIPDRF